MKLILASSSPRRAAVLRDAGFAFEVRVPHVDETRRAGEFAGDYVVRLAEEKARTAYEFRAPRAGEPPMDISALGYTRHLAEDVRAMFRRLMGERKAHGEASQSYALQNSAIALGADTVVVLDGEILGKPADSEDARAMLRRLSGREHDVLTGIALVPFPSGSLLTALERTRVTFAPLAEQEIEDYLATGEPFDKAGAYAIQGRGGRFIERIEGCYFNVVGLPLARLERLLRELGWMEKRD